MGETEPTEQERLNALASELDEKQRGENSGRGVNCLAYVVEDLKRGDLETARVDVLNQSDKFGSVSGETKEWITANLFSDCRSPWENEKQFRQRMKERLSTD